MGAARLTWVYFHYHSHPHANDHRRTDYGLVRDRSWACGLAGNTQSIAIRHWWLCVWKGGRVPRTMRSPAPPAISPGLVLRAVLYSFAGRLVRPALQEAHPQYERAGPLAAGPNGCLASIGVQRSNISSLIWAPRQCELQPTLAPPPLGACTSLPRRSTLPSATASTSFGLA